jgi:threonine synthase
LGEGGTELESARELGLALGVPSLWLKREDLSPTGSHKARSLGYLCSHLLAQGRDQAVISSSGNAAIAAAAFASLAGMRLLSLVSPRTPRVKLNALSTHPQLTVLSEQPVALLHHAVAEWGLSDLRGSVNPLAPNAYRGIAAELAGSDPVEAVFVFSSSGATALGMSQGFQALQVPADRPRLHVVEGLPGGELTRPWYPGGGPRGDRGANFSQLGARRSRLAPAVRRAVRQSGGRGWRIGAVELTRVRELGRSHGLETSWEGLATLAAMSRAAELGTGPGRWVAVLTGAAWQLELDPAPEGELRLPRADSPRELDTLLEGAGFNRQPAP